MPATSTRRPSVAPGSLADRIRRACPQGFGATMRHIIAESLALPEDVKAEVARLREVGYIRVYGRKRWRRYFWRE